MFFLRCVRLNYPMWEDFTPHTKIFVRQTLFSLEAKHLKWRGLRDADSLCLLCIDGVAHVKPKELSCFYHWLLIDQ